MSDARFFRSVILVLHHDEHGAMGVVLNRPIPKQATAIASLLGETLQASEGNFHVGGPVAGPLIVLQGLSSSLGGNRLGTDDGPGRVFVVEKQDQLESLMDGSDSSLQFYVGHAGWGEGQLENEVEDGSWLALPASVDFVFSDSEDMWVEAMREFGELFYHDVLGIRIFPDDTSAN